MDAHTPTHNRTHAPPLEQDSTLSLLRMAVGDELLAVPITQVREILQVSRLTPLPRTPAFVRGVMNLRGAVVPVIDLAVRLGQLPTELGRRSCIVVVDAPQAAEGTADGSAAGTPSIGLLMDGVHEVFDRKGSEIEAPPALGTPMDPAFLQGITRAGGSLIGVLALDEVLNASQLTQNIAAFQPMNPH